MTPAMGAGSREVAPDRFREPDYMGCKRERSGGKAGPEGHVLCYAWSWLTKRLSSGRLVCVISAMGVLASGSLRRVWTRVRRRRRFRRSGQDRGRCEGAADRSLRRFRSISSSATCSSRKASSASAWSSM